MSNGPQTTRHVGLTFALIGVLSAVPVYSRIEPRTPASTHGGLTFEDRIACQRTIEDVYWRHRIWPQENPQPKPTLDQVMPEATLRAKVADYLRQSEALAVYWQRPITASQLQAEMDRMARQTKRPDILQELWSALGNDPYVIAECLARPALANRLIRNWYARDERYQGALRARAEAELGAHVTASQMRAMSGQYQEVEWVNGESQLEPTRSDKSPPLTLSADEWQTKLGELAQSFGTEKEIGGASEEALFERRTGGADAGHSTVQLDLLPTGEWSRLQENDERFYVTAVLGKRNKQLKLATVEWKKEPFDAWWKSHVGAVHALTEQQPSYAYRLPPIKSAAGTCIDDSWQPTLPPYVSARESHTAVWTGSEMIVWGGLAAYAYFNTGGRYDPATDTWTAASTTNAPSARASHTAVWTGSEMIVWGGHDFTSLFNTGGRYDPATDTWTATSTTNAPSARSGQTVVWTGSEMIVWGGLYSINTGGRYDPATDIWTAMSTIDPPSGRYGHTSVWTGSEMIVWGGYTPFSYFNTGGRYNPTTDTWTATSTTNAPGSRSTHTAVWTGSKMIVWGGFPSTNTGGRYDPTTDTWTTTSTTNAPTARYVHTAVWTMSELIVWGGFPLTNTGGRYDPTTDTWTTTSTTNAPSARADQTAVWTGSEMIVWGGSDRCDAYCYPANTGGRYDPASDSWSVTASRDAPSGRWNHTAVWTGSEVIVWGGNAGPFIYFNDGGRYDPATNNWTATATDNVPSRRYGHAAVWTGSEMIVWGGLDHCDPYGCYPTNTGGRYDPAANSWTPSATTNAPSERYVHTAVWTGSDMIVWGGRYDICDPDGCSPFTLNTGGQYNAATNSWRATSTTNAPSARAGQTAVWTGSQMIVWGGLDFTSWFNTGGRYDPSTDTWTATSTTDAPSARFAHTAVWTGSEMVVWGGRFPDTNTGGRYNPAMDSWTTTTTNNAPSARASHTAVWTGSEMIVWGGEAGTFPRTFFSTGGRYDPAMDSWSATSTKNAPSGRALHTAVWTGSEMIVWAGSPDYNGGLDTGGRYCATR